tara:strand:+ start:335 stop:538 length:204 start_codon:yes stop_codon:yes gene_type:complete
MLNCPICDVGVLASIATGLTLGDVATNAEVGPFDVVRKRRCQYCKAEMLSVEKLDRLIKPPDHGVLD